MPSRTARKAASSNKGRMHGGGSRRQPGRANSIIGQLDEIEMGGGDGTIDFGRGRTLRVSSLGKPFFLDAGVTKGDLMRYYATIAPMLLPIIKDRPLILRRYPDGITGPSFVQQNAGAHVPDNVRTARVATVRGDQADRIIGGDLLTLMYIVQIGTIAVHAWQSRVQSARYADSATIDLDPGEGVSFDDVVALARDIKVILDELDLRAAIKTSGSSGLHIVLPLPANTTFTEAARLAQQVAKRVVEANPHRATVERSLAARPGGSIYVDAQQNAEGKSVAAAYSVRERERAPVSAPLNWNELRGTVRIDDFTVETMPARVKRVGDLWGAALKRRNTRRAIDRALRAE